ncbi:MAG TPA: acyl-ACP--UDP-N-acetylglucosamine O-acyltransferase [Vicinamibacterales bacterium]|nr:acyl-ACP--UDP-N-acetylglucosamine O-acyltransferase [Vicinamibacterales bacterium]
MPIDIPAVLERLIYRYPSLLVDAIEAYEPGRRVVAVKNVTISEEFFQGHFPGAPMMPGVLMIETLSQVATVLLLQEEAAGNGRVFLRGVDNAKFRRQVVPGDRLQLEVTRDRSRTGLVRLNGIARVGDQVVAQMDLLIGRADDAASHDLIHPSAIVHPGATIGAGTVVGPHAVIGAHVRIGRNCRIGASSIVDGFTEIGDDCEIFPMASIGLIPQDLKFKGERSRLVIGRRNVFREFVTVHRGTTGGGGETTIGDHNLFMAYVHVAHDCHVGHHTIFGNSATLGGHVTVEDHATISAFSAVHQFCKIGRYAFIGGATIVTKDALPYAKTVGSRPARIFGVNTIGLVRRGFAADVVAKLRHAYRILLVSKLNTSRALAQIEADRTLACDEVRYLVGFIRSSTRGVILRRPTRRMEEMVADE